MQTFERAIAALLLAGAICVLSKVLTAIMVKVHDTNVQDRHNPPVPKAIDVFHPPKRTIGAGFPQCLPQRVGQRPTISGIANPRQVDQRSSTEVYDYLLTNLDHFSAENISHIRTDKSFMDTSGMAILAHCDCVTSPTCRDFGCEIAHPHEIDGSIDVMLHSADVRKVIETGWGERDPLAGGNWGMFSTFGRPLAPENLCFVYAPRTHVEVCILMNITEAGANFVARDDEALDDGHELCPNHYPRPEKAPSKIESL